MACLSQPELSLEQWHREAASSECRQVTRGWRGNRAVQGQLRANENSPGEVGRRGSLLIRLHSPLKSSTAASRIDPVLKVEEFGKVCLMGMERKSGHAFKAMCSLSIH